jgi:hypothetical protein
MSTALEAELLAHLDVQMASGRKLLALVLAQSGSIRARDVEGVLAQLSEIQAEMGRRSVLESDRAALLQRAGIALGVPAAHVTLERLCELVTPGAAAAARDRSAELRGLLGEIAREHGINRALMRQELAFLSHLTRLVGAEHDGGYGPAGATPPGTAPAPGAGSIHRVLDLQA